MFKKNFHVTITVEQLKLFPTVDTHDHKEMIFFLHTTPTLAI